MRTASATGNVADNIKEMILVVEDSAPNQQILLHTLRQIGFDAVGAKNGQEAWDLLNGNEAPKFKMIIADVIMPVLSGIDLLRRVRETPAFANLPYVLVSGTADRIAVVQAKSLNVNAYLLKPLGVSKIIGVVQKVFPKRKLDPILKSGSTLVGVG